MQKFIKISVAIFSICLGMPIFAIDLKIKLSMVSEACEVVFSPVADINTGNDIKGVWYTKTSGPIPLKVTAIIEKDPSEGYIGWALRKVLSLTLNRIFKSLKQPRKTHDNSSTTELSVFPTDNGLVYLRWDMQGTIKSDPKVTQDALDKMKKELTRLGLSQNMALETEEQDTTPNETEYNVGFYIEAEFVKGNKQDFIEGKPVEFRMSYEGFEKYKETLEKSLVETINAQLEKSSAESKRRFEVEDFIYEEEFLFRGTREKMVVDSPKSILIIRMIPEN